MNREKMLGEVPYNRCRIQENITVKQNMMILVNGPNTTILISSRVLSNVLW